MKSPIPCIFIFSNVIPKDGISNSLRCFCNDPTFYTFLTYSYLFYFDKLFMKHLQLMHTPQNYFCQAPSVTCPRDMACSKMCRLSTRVFPGQCKL